MTRIYRRNFDLRFLEWMINYCKCIAFTMALLRNLLFVLHKFFQYLYFCNNVDQIIIVRNFNQILDLNLNTWLLIKISNHWLIKLNNNIYISVKFNGEIAIFISFTAKMHIGCLNQISLLYYNKK